MSGYAGFLPLRLMFRFTWNNAPILNPETGQYIQLGLPFGTKPRLILAHLNAEAIKTASPLIEMEDSLTAFVKRIQNPLYTYSYLRFS